ncbi:MAG: helix-turn-helix domain-containing protein [Pseudomonadota bacterium]
MGKTRKPHGLEKLYCARIAREAAEVVARAHSISVAEILSKDRARARVVYARQMAMYLSHVVGQLSLGQVSHEFGRDRTTVGYSCNAIEDRRDGPFFDKEIAGLECELRGRLTSLLTCDVGAPAPLRAAGD